MDEIVQEQELAAVENIADMASGAVENPGSYASTLSAYLPRLDQYYVPEWVTMKLALSSVFSCTPLFSYGSTVVSLERSKTALGFSIDICATMLIASVLKISYYFIEPFETPLLIQALCMVFIQVILLRTTLKYRPEEYKYDNLQTVEPFTQLIHDVWFEYFAIRSKPKMFSEEWRSLLNSLSVKRLLGFTLKIILVFVYKFLKFFDPSFKRIWSFWQWNDDRKYWKFLAIFASCQFFFTFLIVRVLNWEELASRLGSLMGALGLLIESLLPLPQISILYKLKSVQGFKLILLFSWLCGDTFKLYFLLNLGVGKGGREKSSLFVFFAFFQMSLDFYIGGQYIYYKYYYNPEGTVVGGSSDNDGIQMQESTSTPRIEPSAFPLTATDEKIQIDEYKQTHTGRRLSMTQVHMSPQASRHASIGSPNDMKNKHHFSM